jgi:hypothetical protein
MREVLTEVADAANASRNKKPRDLNPWASFCE